MNEKLLLIKIGERIKKHRELKKITQNALVIECNFEKANMSRIESGKTNVTIHTLYKISRALEVELAVFFKD